MYSVPDPLTCMFKEAAHGGGGGGSSGHETETKGVRKPRYIILEGLARIMGSRI